VQLLGHLVELDARLSGQRGFLLLPGLPGKGVQAIYGSAVEVQQHQPPTQGTGQGIGVVNSPLSGRIKRGEHNKRKPHR
jgi:hypothetical protein